MKKFLSLLLVATLVFALSACGKDKDTIVKEDTNKTTEQKETDKVHGDKAGASDKNDDDSQTENSNKSENNSSNEQSSADSTTDTNNTTTNDSSNKNNSQSNSNGTTTKPNTNTQTNTHKHSFSAATCTQPKKCSCGATEGSALGHTYASATCTKPKTCSCGATSGNALGHNYDEDGICTRCTAKDPNFTYPTVNSMDGSWTQILETNMDEGRGLSKVYFYFGSGEAGFSIMYYLLEEDWIDNFGPLDTVNSIVWNNKRYYLFNGEDPSAGGTTFSESDNKIVITDPSNGQIVLQRTSTKTMKVLSVDWRFAGYDELLTNMILTFEKN